MRERVGRVRTTVWTGLEVFQLWSCFLSIVQAVARQHLPGDRESALRYGVLETPVWSSPTHCEDEGVEAQGWQDTCPESYSKKDWGEAPSLGTLSQNFFLKHR